MPTEVQVALFGLVGVVVTAVIGYLGVRKQTARLVQTEREVEFQSAALNFSAFLSDWDGIHQDLVQLMKDTEIDRFLILRAWNGALKPRWTTAVFQLREAWQEPVSYVHFELDRDYVERLCDIVQRGWISFTVESNPDSLIMQVYEAEGVKSSAWFHLEDVQIKGTESRAVTYCSFASHTLESIDPATLTKCQIIASRLKGIAAVFRDKNRI